MAFHVGAKFLELKNKSFGTVKVKHQTKVKLTKTQF